MLLALLRTDLNTFNIYNVFCAYILFMLKSGVLFEMQKSYPHILNKLIGCMQVLSIYSFMTVQDEQPTSSSSLLTAEGSDKQTAHLPNNLAR